MNTPQSVAEPGPTGEYEAERQDMAAEIKRLTTENRILKQEYNRAETYGDEQRAEMQKYRAENARLRAALKHIGYQRPTSDVGLDWVGIYKDLQAEARKALEQGGVA